MSTHKQHPWRAKIKKSRTEVEKQVTKLKQRIEPNLIPQSPMHTRMIVGCLGMGLVVLSWDIVQNWEKSYDQFTGSLSALIPVALVCWWSGALLLGRNNPKSWTLITMVVCVYLASNFWYNFSWTHLQQRIFWVRAGLCAIWLSLTAVLLYRIWFGEAIPNRTRGREVKFRSADSRSETENESDVETPWGSGPAQIKPVPGLSLEQWWGGAYSRPVEVAPPPPKGKIDNSLLFLASTKFLNCFTPAQFMEAYGRVEWEELKEGELLFTKGDDSKSGMYVVTSGTLGMYGPVNQATDMLICEFGKGESVGDLEIITGEARDFTCRATSSCSLIRVTRELFQELYSTILVSYVRTYLARQWRIADFVLTEFWRLTTNNPRESRYRVEALEHFFTPEEPLFCAMKKAYQASLKPATEEAEGTESDGGTQEEYEFIVIEAGELLFDVGACSEERMYVLLQGKMGLTYRGTKTRVEVGPGAVLGCLSYLASTSKKSSARAMSRCVFAVLTNAHFANPTPSLLAIVMAVVETMGPTLKQFSQLGLQRGWRRAGEILYHQGHQSEDFFIIVAGRARVVSHPKNNNAPVSVAHLVRDPRNFRHEVARGDSVGEVTFLAGKNAVHMASVIAIRDLDLVRVSRASFELIKTRHPDAVVKLSIVMGQKYARMTAGLDSPAMSDMRYAAEGVPLHNHETNAIVIALLPTTSANLAVFVPHLARALAIHGSTLCLTREKVDAVLGSGTTASIGEFFHRNHFSCWIAEQEEVHSFILLEVGREANAWSKMCVRLADLIMIVADAGDSPGVSTFEQATVWEESVASTVLCRKQLVLLHPKDTVLPQGTRKWFARRRLDTYHHVRVNDPDHYARLARIIANKAVGVVLSGGGARGLAHLGTLQSLHESHIPIDYIGGTSQGSLMGALYALRPIETAEDLEAYTAKVTELSQKMGSVLQLLADATWPIMSYFEGKVFGENISALLGADVQIEDLWIKYFAITTNVTKADQEVHRLGTLWKAVRGSMTLLSFLPPMQVNGELLIDGGYVNNFPCDVMRKTCQPRFVLGVDVENKAEPHLQNVTFYGNSLSGGWLLKQRLWNIFNPFSERVRVPRYSQLVQSLLYINHNRTVRNQLSARLMDLYVCPDLGDTQLLDYHKMTHIVELGANCARPLVQQFRTKNAHLLPPLVAPSIVEQPLNRWSSLSSLTTARPEEELKWEVHHM